MIIDVSCCDVPWTHVNFIFYRYYISACVPFSAWKLLTLPQVEYPLCKKCAQAVPKRSQWAKEKVEVMRIRQDLASVSRPGVYHFHVTYCHTVQTWHFLAAFSCVVSSAYSITSSLH